MTPTITLRQLRFLVAVADEQSISRAAEICLVTQPTLSAGLKELEERLGVQLAERSKRGVILTPIGQRIVDRAREILLATRGIEELAAAHSTPEGGELRLGVIPTIGPYLIPRALPAIRQAFPELKLLLREELTADLLDGLNSGRLDLILFAQPFAAPGLITMPLFDDGYHLAAPPGSLGLEPVSCPVGGAELEHTRLLLLEQGHCLQRHALSAFPDHNLQQDESFSATSLSTLISMVGEGLGSTLLPDLAIDAGVLNGQDVAIAPLPGAAPRKVALAWRASSARGRQFAQLGEILRQVRMAL